MFFREINFTNFCPGINFLFCQTDGLLFINKAWDLIFKISLKKCFWLHSSWISVKLKSELWIWNISNHFKHSPLSSADVCLCHSGAGPNSNIKQIHLEIHVAWQPPACENAATCAQQLKSEKTKLFINETKWNNDYFGVSRLMLNARRHHNSLLNSLGILISIRKSPDVISRSDFIKLNARHFIWRRSLKRLKNAIRWKLSNGMRL